MKKLLVFLICGLLEPGWAIKILQSDTAWTKLGGTVNLVCQLDELPEFCSFIRPDGKELCQDNNNSDMVSASCTQQDRLYTRIETGSSSCRLEINSVQPHHFGDWTCKTLAWDEVDEAKVRLETLRQGEVEIKDLWGSVTLEADQEQEFTCQLDLDDEMDEKDRVEIIWALETPTTGDTTILQNMVNQRTLNAREYLSTLKFQPTITDHTKRLVCFTNIADEKDAIELRIFKYSASDSSIPTVLKEKQGEDARVVYEFDAYPLLQPEQVKWFVGDEENPLHPGETDSSGKIIANAIGHSDGIRHEVVLVVTDFHQGDVPSNSRLELNIDTKTVPVPFSVQLSDTAIVEEVDPATEVAVPAVPEGQRPPYNETTAAPEETVVEKESMSIIIVIGIVVLCLLLCIIYYGSRCCGKKKRKEEKEAEAAARAGKEDDLKSVIVEGAQGKGGDAEATAPLLPPVSDLLQPDGGLEASLLHKLEGTEEKGRAKEREVQSPAPAGLGAVAVLTGATKGEKEKEKERREEEEADEIVKTVARLDGRSPDMSPAERSAARDDDNAAIAKKLDDLAKLEAEMAEEEEEAAGKQSYADVEAGLGPDAKVSSPPPASTSPAAAKVSSPPPASTSPAAAKVSSPPPASTSPPADAKVSSPPPASTSSPAAANGVSLESPKKEVKTPTISSPTKTATLEISRPKNVILHNNENNKDEADSGPAAEFPEIQLTLQLSPVPTGKAAVRRQEETEAPNGSSRGSPTGGKNLTSPTILLQSMTRPTNEVRVPVALPAPSGDGAVGVAPGIDGAVGVATSRPPGLPRPPSSSSTTSPTSPSPRGEVARSNTMDSGTQTPRMTAKNIDFGFASSGSEESLEDISKKEMLKRELEILKKEASQQKKGLEGLTQAETVGGAEGVAPAAGGVAPAAGGVAESQSMYL